MLDRWFLQVLSYLSGGHVRGKTWLLLLNVSRLFLRIHSNWRRGIVRFRWLLGTAVISNNNNNRFPRTRFLQTTFYWMQDRRFLLERNSVAWNLLGNSCYDSEYPLRRQQCGHGCQWNLTGHGGKHDKRRLSANNIDRVHRFDLFRLILLLGIFAELGSPTYDVVRLLHHGWLRRIHNLSGAACDCVFAPADSNPCAKDIVSRQSRQLMVVVFWLQDHRRSGWKIGKIWTVRQGSDVFRHYRSTGVRE